MNIKYVGSLITFNPPLNFTFRLERDYLLIARTLPPFWPVGYH